MDETPIRRQRNRFSPYTCFDQSSAVITPARKLVARSLFGEDNARAIEFENHLNLSGLAKVGLPQSQKEKGIDEDIDKVFKSIG